MIIQIVGKQTFHSSKKNQDYFVLHCIFSKEGVEGYACEGKFVSSEIFGKASINKSYSIVYDAYSNGRAFISDIKEVNSSK